jgi:hypothetical protein
MPALNVKFTDAEIERLRERARNEGVSMKTMAHDTIVNCGDQSDMDARKAAAIARAIRRSRELLELLAGQ